MSAIVDKIERAKSEIDPITFEVVRNKLQAITEEQAITLKAASGSPVVTDATDFNNGLYLADGSMVTMGPQVIIHAGTMSRVVQHIIREFGENPGIEEGDMFLLNDPYRGAIHQPDMSIVAPIFHEGRLIAWAGTCAHQLDVGGMSFGSWALGATEIQQEAILLPGIKLVQRGVLRKDLWQMIMGMTRLPPVLGLDLKAMIAANTVAARGVDAIINRYGADTVETVMKTEIDTTERQFRARIAALPDGIFRARDYLEHDGHANRLYEICLAVEKRGDELIFDFSGTSPQAPGFINCTISGAWGGILTGVIPIVAPGLRWNEGLLRPLSIKAEEGIVCNASWPAPVSAGTVSAVWVVINVAVAALSRMVAVGGMRKEGQAITKGSMAVLTLAGVGRHGEPFGTFLLDSTAGGGGAYQDHDGLDGSGDYCVPRPAISNVEMAEASGPFRYLFRGFVPDTGGAGTMRGGVTTALAVTPHDVDGLHACLLGHGVEVPNSAGLFGGYEGSCGKHLLMHRSESSESAHETYSDLSAIQKSPNTRTLGAKPGHMTLAAGDVLAYSFQGGGGYGDPLLRDPVRVEHDVGLGFVSQRAAADIYGVVLTASGSVDAVATEHQRKLLRHHRLGGGTLRREVTESGAIEINNIYELICACGANLGSLSQDWKHKAKTRSAPKFCHGSFVSLHDELEIREHLCPDCGTLLESEVVRIGDDSLRTIEIHSLPISSVIKMDQRHDA